MFHLFPNFKSKILLDRVLGEPNYTIIWLNLQELWILLGGCLTVKN